jgi:glutamyl-tRNA reductase
MKLNPLWIGEWPSVSVSAPISAPKGSLLVSTCQRQLVAAHQGPLEGAKRSAFGTEAYELLLRFSCGLESAVVGETDVFGQLKSALKQQWDTLPTELRSVFQSALEDAKDIRTQHLQGVSVASYGSLSRSLLRPKESDRILALGAGQMAKSVLPYLAESKITLWNRTLERAIELSEEIIAKGYNAPAITTDAQSSIAGSDIVVILTPAGHELDAEWIDALSKSNARILHLGGTVDALSSWSHLENLITLSDLFELSKQKGTIRDLSVERAKKACKERALLRSMGGSLSLAHGWEDLAQFTK